MKTTLAIVSALLISLWSCGPRRPAYGTAYLNGKWFDGERFVSTSFYVADGLLTQQAPTRVDTVINLGGGFVVPAFAEAHNHNVESSRFDDVNRRYIEDGIFYVKNPNSLSRFTDPIRSRVGRFDAVDATFAGGGLTSTGGHPIEIVDRMIELGRWTAVDGDGAFYWVIDNEDDLERRWPEFLASKPDFVKVYLLYSEDHAARMADSTTFGWRGLDPKLVPLIVERAHAEGLQVSAHVETASDFHTAVTAGVDEVNHLPGFRADEKEAVERYRIVEADARLAGERGIVVVTTVSAFVETLEQLEGGSAAGTTIARYRRLLKDNLELLRIHGVKLAVGSDRYEHTSVSEALALHRLGVFAPQELLTMWCETTAATIFPDRKIGRLAEGYEASFLVLEDNPLKDFQSVTKIRMRVKQGARLE